MIGQAATLVGKVAGIYLLSALLVVGLVCSFFKTTGLVWLEWFAKVGVTIGLTGLGVWIFFRAPRFYKLIGVVLSVMGISWSIIAWS